MNGRSEPRWLLPMMIVWTASLIVAAWFNYVSLQANRETYGLLLEFRDLQRAQRAGKP